MLAEQIKFNRVIGCGLAVLTLVLSVAASSCTSTPPPFQEDRIKKIFSEQYGLAAGEFTVVEMESREIVRTKLYNPATGKTVQTFGLVPTDSESIQYVLAIDADYNVFTEDELLATWRVFEEQYGLTIDTGLIYGVARALLTDTVPVEIWVDPQLGREALVSLIEKRGFHAVVSSDVAPTVFGELSKSLILEIAGRPETDVIYQWEQTLDLGNRVGKPKLLGEDLPLEVLRYGDGQYSPTEPHLAVVTAVDQPGFSSAWLNRVDQEIFEGVDFSKYLVLAAFNGYGATVIVNSRVCNKESAVFVVIRARHIVEQVFTSPYLMAVIKKDLIPNLKELVFELQDEFGQTLSTSHVE